MLSTCKVVAAARWREGAQPGEGRPCHRHRRAASGEGGREGVGVQEWPDGSRYEGAFVNGLKHGRGRYTWRNGEYYEGSFYKDYRHGDGLYCWPSAHKFTGKFYLNRKEGYGKQLFPDGTTFQGLYHVDQRFGPGVLSHPDGCEDVGLWLGGYLLKLCGSVEQSFSLKNVPEYATYMNQAASIDSLTQPPPTHLETEFRTVSELDTNRDLLSDENCILPPGMESYSTDGEHLPLPPGRRKELDQHFYGEQWESDVHPHRGYARDPLSSLPLQARMQAHINKHRLQAEHVGWDVAAVLSMNRDSFGPKGPLEVSSELLIHHASTGNLQAVSQILQTGLVHTDVADSQGHSALIAATVNCHNDVIQLLLDMGANIDKLNCEGMSALAVCHVLYYPFKSLHNTKTDTPAKTQGLESLSAHENIPQISQVDLTANRFNTDLRAITMSNYAEQSADEVTNHILDNSGDNELIAECRNEPHIPTDTDDLQEERKEGEREERKCKDPEREVKVTEREEKSSIVDENRNKVEEREMESRCDHKWETSGIEGWVRELEDGEEDVKLGGRTAIGSRKEHVELREEFEQDAEKKNEEDIMESGGDLEHFVQVLDGHMCQATAAGGIQQAKDKEVSPTPASACSASSHNVQVTVEATQHSAEVLSHTGITQRSDTQENTAEMKSQHVRLNTLKLLLERGADPNASKVPIPALFLAIMAADTEAVRRLLLRGARSDVPLPAERNGLYPLHVAAALPGPAGPAITELLLHTIMDPDAQACDQNEIYEADKISMKIQDPLSTSDNPSLKEGGRTALHMACQRDSDYQNASKVVALLLSHRACTDLLWSGHSPLSLAIASGNDLAVEELLKGGADPSIPLGRRVGSALCALANVNYHLGGNKLKLLDMLAKAGADIQMPVMVGDVVGTAVDYAHYSFNQDQRIANTPFHALNLREREKFKSRHQLLSMMGDLLRQTAHQNLKRERLMSNRETPVSTGGKHRKAAFKFCYQCGRSVSVRLTACTCRKVFYCSRICKLKSWDEGHGEECIQVSAPAHGLQKAVVFKPPRGPGPLAGILKSHRAPKSFSMAEKVSESQVNLKENYSCN